MSNEEQTTVQPLYVATRIPNGYNDGIQYFYGWCRHYNLTCADGKWVNGVFIILMDRDNVECLNQVREHAPQIFGSPRELEEFVES